jgi:hypothetical protein
MALTDCYSAIVAAAFLIVSPKDIVRDDGRHIAIFKKPNVRDEIMGTLAVVKDPKIIILLPAMFAGEMILAPASSINGMISYPIYIKAVILNQLQAITSISALGRWSTFYATLS